MERLNCYVYEDGTVLAGNSLFDDENNVTIRNSDTYHVVTHVVIYDLSVVKLYYEKLNTIGLDAIYDALCINKYINDKYRKYVNSIIHEYLVEYCLKYNYISNIYRDIHIYLNNIRNYLEWDLDWNKEDIDPGMIYLNEYTTLLFNNQIKHLDVVYEYLHGFIDMLFKSINNDLDPAYNISEFGSYIDPTGKFSIHDIDFSSAKARMVVKKYIGVIPYASN